MNTNDADERKIVVTKTKDRILAIGFILGADKGRYSGMVRGFENTYTAGRDEWPKSLADAHRTLTNWKREVPSGIPRGESEGVSFSTEGTSSSNKGPRCWTCGEYGHTKWHFHNTEAKK